MALGQRLRAHERAKRQVVIVYSSGQKAGALDRSHCPLYAKKPSAISLKNTQTSGGILKRSNVPLTSIMLALASRATDDEVDWTSINATNLLTERQASFTFHRIPE